MDGEENSVPDRLAAVILRFCSRCLRSSLGVLLLPFRLLSPVSRLVLNSLGGFGNNTSTSSNTHAINASPAINSCPPLVLVSESNSSEGVPIKTVVEVSSSVVGGDTPFTANTTDGGGSSILSLLLLWMEGILDRIDSVARTNCNANSRVGATTKTVPPTRRRPCCCCCC